MSPASLFALTSLAAVLSLLGAVASYRCLARARTIASTPRPTELLPLTHDASLRVRYLRSLTAIGTTLEAMRANFEHDSAVFGNVEPPVTELAELCAAAAALGRSLDVGILHATMYWLREHCYQRAFTIPSAEVHECRGRIDAALWETRRLMGLTQETPLPRTLADVEALAELATPTPIPMPAPVAAPLPRGRRTAARRETRVAPVVVSAGQPVRTATVH